MCHSSCLLKAALTYSGGAKEIYTEKRTISVPVWMNRDGYTSFSLTKYKSQGNSYHKMGGNIFFSFKEVFETKHSTRQEKTRNWILNKVIPMPANN